MKEKSIWLALRFLLGFTFLWAFIDKMFGFGFATEAKEAWINGGSPTYGYLTFATKGPFESVFKSLADVQIVEYLFMAGLFFVGISLLTGIMFRLGTLAGMSMLALFYVSGFMPPEHNPLIDEHVINFTLMLGLYYVVPTERYSFSAWWNGFPLVQKHQFLR